MLRHRIHPALIAFAKSALQTSAVQLYQCNAWAKFTGEADYDQPFHCDFPNHTLTVPSEQSADNAVTVMCYFSDVTEAHGPLHTAMRRRRVSRGRATRASDITRGRSIT